MSATDATPTHVGPYRVVRLVAQGGMSVVYEVTDPDTGKSLAAKVLTERGQSVPRFGREYRALTRLDHPNVVRVYRYGMTEDGQPYLIMELLHGVPAQVRVKSLGRPGEPVRTAEAARIAMKVASALEYLHARGIVHRDLKSSNVIVLGDGQVKLLDFGTARLLHTREALTDPGEFVGTFHYASPEQLSGGEILPASDLYALGVLLYRMLTGRRPFESDHPPTLARMHMEVVPTPPNRIVPGIPEPLSAICMRLLAKKPEERPESASWLAEHLRVHTLAAAGSLPSVEPSLRMIGRAAQLRGIQAMLDAPTAGAALFFTGADGSGRSRLVGLALEEAQSRGYRTFEVPFSANARPLVALCEQVASTFAAKADNAVVRQARAVVSGASPLDAQVLARVLAARAGADSGPLVLGARSMESGERGEVETFLAALERLFQEGSMVITFASWSERPLPRAWAGAHTVQVPPLTATEVAVLVSQRLGVASVSPELVRRLLSASGGMPAPLEQLVRALSSDRDAREVPIAVPAPVRDELLVRLESLSRLHRRAAEAVALAEGDLVLAQLAHAIDETEDDTLAALNSLVAGQFLIEQGGRWTFRVGVAGELVRERLRPTRRHVLCRRIADTVSQNAASPRIARALLEAGQIDAAATTAVAWAAPLARAGMHAEALPLLERVAAARGQATADSPLWRLYAECLAEVRPEGSAADHAISRARASAAHVGELGDADVLAARLARSRGDTSEERTMLERAVERLGRAGDRTRSGIACERLAELDLVTGTLETARRHATAAVQRLRGPDEHRAQVLLATVQSTQGDLRAAEATLHHVFASGDTDELTAWRAASAFADVCRLQGRFSEARSRLAGLLPSARIQAPAAVFAGICLAAAQLDIDLYRVGQARERIAQAADAAKGSLTPTVDAMVALLGARLAVLAGDSQGAVRILEPAVDRAQGRQLTLYAARLQAARGIAWMRVGRVAAGEQELTAATNLLRSAGALPALAEVAIARAELADGREDPAILFADVASWMEMQPARVVRLEYLLAALRWAESDDRGRESRRERAAALRGQAETLFGQIRAMLSPEEETSLGVHPWRQILRWG
jgi:hypothetical protein